MRIKGKEDEGTEIAIDLKKSCLRTTGSKMLIYQSFNYRIDFSRKLHIFELNSLIVKPWVPFPLLGILSKEFNRADVVRKMQCESFLPIGM